MTGSDRPGVGRDVDPDAAPDSGSAPDTVAAPGSETDSVAAPQSGSGPSRLRSALGYALLFSLPVGVGIAVMMLQVTGGRPTDALVAGPSLAIAAAVFLLVVAIGVGGSRDQ